jgi:hypothetical protein
VRWTVKLSAHSVVVDVRSRQCEIILPIPAEQIEEIHWEARVERDCCVDCVHVLFAQFDPQSLVVYLHMLNRASADDREDIWCFMKEICQSLGKMG